MSAKLPPEQEAQAQTHEKVVEVFSRATRDYNLLRSTDPRALLKMKGKTVLASGEIQAGGEIDLVLLKLQQEARDKGETTFHVQFDGSKTGIDIPVDAVTVCGMRSVPGIGTNKPVAWIEKGAAEAFRVYLYETMNLPYMPKVAAQLHEAFAAPPGQADVAGEGAKLTQIIRGRRKLPGYKALPVENIEDRVRQALVKAVQAGESEINCLNLQHLPVNDFDLVNTATQPGKSHWTVLVKGESMRRLGGEAMQAVAPPEPREVRGGHAGSLGHGSKLRPPQKIPGREL